MTDTFNEDEEIEIEIEDETTKKPEELSLFTKIEHPKQCFWLKKEVNPYECVVCFEDTDSKTVQICKYFDEYWRLKKEVK